MGAAFLHPLGQIDHLDVHRAGAFAGTALHTASGLVESADDVPGLCASGSKHTFAPFGGNMVHKTLGAVAHRAGLAARVTANAAVCFFRKKLIAKIG